MVATLDQETPVRAWQVAASALDPELPMLTVGDLGILRELTVEGGRVVVSLTPTYSGCPAMREIQQDVCGRLRAAGFGDVDVRMVLSPAWSTDWITADGRRKLAAAGIAPPGLGPSPALVSCPACGSPDTRRTAAFGGTACRDLYRCQACAEPFEHVKEI